MRQFSLVGAIVAGAVLGAVAGGAFWTISQRAKEPVKPEPHQVAAQLAPYAANGLANVSIVFWSNTHRGFAERVSSAFQLAKWDVNYTNVAQEIRNPNFFSGIEVRGSNKHLVDEAAKAVLDLGGWDMRTQVDQLTIARDNPKFARSQQTVHITIGYPKQ